MQTFSIFCEMLNDSTSATICEVAEAGLAAKAKKSGISIDTLRKVYRRGVAAWNSGHRPGTTPQQWGMARVNSYITHGKGTYGGADKDLHEEELLEVAKDEDTGLSKKYVAGIKSKSTKEARAAHFRKTSKMSDSDPAAYEPAPGDATAKTKPSKYTLKYHQMFDENIDEEIYEACWKGYKQVGVKKKNKKMVPNCVEVSEDLLNERGEDSKGYKRSTESGAGLTRKGAKHFGVKTAVTTPPSKLKPNSKAAKRRKSFCARMSGMPGPMKDEKGRPTRKAASLKRWKCN